MHWIWKLLRMIAAFPLALSHAFWHLHWERICKCWLKMQKDYHNLSSQNVWSLRLSGWFQLQSWKFTCSCRVQIQCQRFMLRHMGPFVYSSWPAQQQQSREGGCVLVLAQQIRPWLQRGKLDYFASVMKQSIPFSCLQIFHMIFGWHLSIFVLGEMKEPKKHLLLSQPRQKNIFLTGCWISLLESLLGRANSSRTLYTSLPLLSQWQEMNICSFSSSWRSAWSNRGKRATGRCFLKEDSAFCNGRCWVFIPVHTVPSAILHRLPINSREALTHFCSSLVSKTVIGSQNFWKGSFGRCFCSIQHAIAFLLLLNQSRIWGSH